MEIKMINNKKINSLIKSKKRLLNSLFFWSTIYLISGQIIHNGLRLSYKLSLPLTSLVIYINYLAFKIRLRNYNNEILDLILFNKDYAISIFKNKLI